MSDDFFKTGMGRKFYEQNIPRLVTALEKVAEQSPNAVVQDRKAFDAIPHRFRVSQDLSECIKAMAAELES